jgi:integrase
VPFAPNTIDFKVDSEFVQGTLVAGLAELPKRRRRCRAGHRRTVLRNVRKVAASLLIAAGVELVEVSMLLAHSELRVTADLYSHLQRQTAAKAARHMDKVFA